MPDEMRNLMPQINETQMAVAYPNQIMLGYTTSFDEDGVLSAACMTLVFDDGEFTVSVPAQNMRELGEGLIEMAGHLGG